MLAAGYAPAVGFLHTGKPLSFVYDIADIFKFETVVPAAFSIGGGILSGRLQADPDMAVRLSCRDFFRKTRLLSRLIPAIDEVLKSGGLEIPANHEEAQPVAIKEESFGNVGHRG